MILPRFLEPLTTPFFATPLGVIQLTPFFATPLGVIQLGSGMERDGVCKPAALGGGMGMLQDNRLARVTGA